MSEACAAEPGVIDRDMLVRLVIEQGAKGEAGKLFLEDGIRLDEVEEIRIEFLSTFLSYLILHRGSFFNYFLLLLCIVKFN